MSKVVTGEAKAPLPDIPDQQPVRSRLQSQTGGGGSRLSRTSSPAVRQQGNNDGFTIPAYNRRRLERKEYQERRGQIHQSELQHRVQSLGRRRPIIGQAEVDNGLRATPMPSRDFFVYRVHKDDGTAVMSDYLKKKNVIVRDITKMNHDAAKLNSFKTTVSLGDAGKVADAQFWPQGIYFRRWRDSRQIQNEDQESQAGDAATS